MEQYLFEEDDHYLSPAVVVTTALLALVFVVGLLYRAAVVLG